MIKNISHWKKAISENQLEYQIVDVEKSSFDH